MATAEQPLAGLPHASPAVSTELADQWLRNEAPELGEMDAIEIGNVDRLTRPRVFQYEFQAAQEGSAILVLTPVALGT